MGAYGGEADGEAGRSVGQRHEFGDVERLKGFQDPRSDLSPETRDLVLALRGLFEATGLSLRAFAATHHFSAPSVSRYLKGDRIPDKQFLDVLMKSACRRNGRQVTAELQAHLYQRHRDALLSDNPARYREQMAGDRLEDAVLEREQAELRIRDLEGELTGHRRQLDELRERLRQIGTESAEERPQQGAALDPHRRQADLEARCDRLQATVEELEAELAEAVRERDAARARCAELEAELAVAEEAAERERLERLVAEERLREARAADTADRHRADLDHARREAEQVRRAAEREAAERREAAEAQAREIIEEANHRVARIRPAVVSRSTALRRLRSVALEAADEALPRLAAQLAGSDPGEVELSVRPFGVHAKDEIGDLARAFDRLLREAVRLLGEQAGHRLGLLAVHADLARRNQALLTAQLTLLTDLQTHETDPDQLEKLFRLDHLAIRMRRNSENLLTLIGHEPARRFDGPVPLVDVVRAAASEVEDYERIELAGSAAAEVVGGAVTDIVHLLAELLENATVFSPPHTTVRVQTARLHDGRVLVEIRDRGLGLSAMDFADLNHRLGTPPSAADPAGRLGLYVVGRLAARRGVRVQLRPDGGETVALVILPADLVAGAAWTGEEGFDAENVAAAP
ncbi:MULTISPECIES: ATP-binding protein [unclassified Streptomyces]|uniref:sensor histidine kinase n=1 Tax=unclassified Streptomyces TaxID=2593676 RepID=UPI003D75BFE8